MTKQHSFIEPTFPTDDYQTEPTEELISDGEQTFVETHSADALTVAARKKGSAFAAAFNAVMRRAGLIRASNELGIDPNEIMRLYLVMIDAAQRTEHFAERDGVPCSKSRRFQASAATMEMYFKRQTLPPELEKGSKEYLRWMGARARSWRRRWSNVHRLQRHLHLGFFGYEKGTATSHKKIAGHYTDRLTDLLVDVARRAGGKDEPINRYNRAADAALAHFRETTPAYAPEWMPETLDPKAETKAGSKKNSPAPASWTEIEKATRRLVEDALRVVREERLTEDESYARREELQAMIETLWTDAPDETPDPANREGAPCPIISPPPPVIVNADTPPDDAPVIGLDRTPVSYLNQTKSENHSAKSQTDPGINAHRSGSPEADAEATAEAFESVGPTRLKAAFLGIYPLAGEAEILGSESLSAAQFKARAADYVKRSHERKQNVAIRAWGALVQVDDCSREVFERLKLFAFFAVETSPGNYQVWLALPSAFIGGDGKINEAGKALRKRLLKKFEENGETANGGAYGSTRLPGTLNIKEKYQSSFPLIRLAYVAKGRIVSPEELDRAGMLAPEEGKTVTQIASSPRFTSAKLPTHWPDYQSFVSRAPLKEDGQPNLSRADESFVVRCYSLGHSRHSIAAKLRSVRDKAARRDDYVERTLNAAESYLAAQPQTVFNGRTGARERMVV